jgi:hypothetical protein
MATILIANGTAAQLSNVNAAGDDVPAYSTLVAVLTAAEQEVIMAASDAVAFIKSTNSDEQRRLVSKVLRLGTNPGK